MNFTSNNSFVFPSAYRKYDLNGRFTGEGNFINIIKCLTTTETDSFVVDYLVNGKPSAKYQDGTLGTLQVVIGGYYFELKDIQLYANLTLYIKRDGEYLKNFTNNTTELDVDGSFTGISDTNDGNATAWLKVTDNDHNIINHGYIKELVDNNGNWINLNLFFKNLTAGGAGSSNRPIYLSNSEGFIPLSATVGQRPMQINANYQNTFLSNGTITEGQRITISTESPGNDSHNLRPGAKIGDLWFVVRN